MIKNYLKIAWRNMVHNKVYSALNIVGLAAGLAVAMLIALWVNYQFSYDKFLPDGSQLYQVRRNFNSNGDTLTFSSSSLKLADALRHNIPEIEYVAETDWTAPHGLMVGDKKLFPIGLQAGSDFLKMFQYPLTHGNRAAALTDPLSIVLSESTAKALFGSTDVMGKTVRVDNRDNLKVTAIMKDIPANATKQFSYIIPFSYLAAIAPDIKAMYAGSFSDNNFQIFAQLKPGIKYTQVAAKIRDIEKSETNSTNAMNSDVIMQPIADWHLYAGYKNGKALDGFIQYVRIFSIIGLLVLVIACINFINLSTARSEKRAREVGVRKAVGSRRQDLIFQFLTESTLITFCSFLLSIIIVQLALPAFNSLTGTAIGIPYSSTVFWLITITGVLLTAMLAGSRPAFYLSGFNPVRVLKGAVSAGKNGGLSRKILVVTQFSCSIALIISTVIIYRQIQYAKDRPTGYSANQLLMTSMNNDLNKNYDVLKNDLLQNNVVASITTATSPATNVNGHTDIDFPGKLPGETIEMGRISVSGDYFKTLGMKMAEGRDFIQGSKSDTLSVIFNQAAIKRMRLTKPINQMVTLYGNKLRIVGVVKDALMNSPFASADPTMFVYGGGDYMMYRLPANVNVYKTIEKLTAIAAKYSPSYPFVYSFVDQEYNQKFSEEVLVGKLAGIFALLAVFISCLGLFGLSAFVAEQRTKEIGVRKVLGASVTQVWLLLSKDFVTLVLLSCLVASPIAFYFLSHWLMKYDYHISIGLDVFMISGVSAIVIALATVSFQSIKAALANPVKSLKTE